MVRSRGPLRSPGVGISNCWGKDDQWGLRRGDETEWGGSPEPIVLCWRKTQGVFRPFWNFSGVNQGGLPMQGNWASTAVCGEVLGLVEISNDSMEDDRKALCLARPISQEEGAWVDEGWEESDLARKRRERIHSKAMLEKSKFEKELRRLECSVNYEGGKKRKGTVQGRGCQIWKSNENKAFELNEFGSGRFLDWGALEAQGTAGGILICWDKRTLEILEMEMGQFTISCRLRNVEDGKTWIFTGVYGPFSKDERDTFWGSLGRLGESGMTLGVLGWGRNNQAWARLDRFLVTQDWLDCFSGVLQCRLPRPVSDHFPILLKGGGGRGRASFRVASKLKFLKDKIKSWNRKVFGRVEVNKNLALQQVEFWDRELWLREGDKNTGFFHRMANAHRRNNSMDKIKINGRWLEEEREARMGSQCLLAVLLGVREGGNCGRVQGTNQLAWGVYKLLAKVLSNRIKEVLDKVVSPDQNVFVKGRQILDASLIANEVMRKMGFGDRWLKWIWWCISTASFLFWSMAVPAGYFSNSRGYAKHPREGGMEINVSHLLFVDDTIIFCEARQDHITYLSWILVWFEAASGLRINLAKSEVIPVGEVEDIEMLAVELGCKWGPSLRFIWGCLWEPSTRPRLCGMGLKQE
ncbi:hypothetical protein CK203_097805 [Vitis vinifera]|uniref:Reverse transcriptase domain-containing protein n=1 Tax=Vitis vinifera TaxID=29760 RepID=A0A438D4X8_VITVI|nr:hypothetical protein CK203_097805 [Vitis vinifera]